MRRWPVRLRRLLVAAGVLAGGVLSTSSFGGATAGADHGASLLPEGILLREATGATLLGDGVSADGRRMDNAIFHSTASVADVLADLRAHWESRPVDLHVEEREGAALLAAIDVHGGQRWTASIRPGADGGTEIVRTIQWIERVRAAERPLPLTLPSGWAVVSTLDDAAGPSPSTTWVLATEDDEASLQPAAVAAGWVAASTASVSATLPTTTYHRADARLFLTEGPGPLDLWWTTLRLEPR